MRPLLAPQDDPIKNKSFFQKLVYPMLVSPKIDGIRGLSLDVATSRTGKALANLEVQSNMARCKDIDAEITDGEPTGPFVMKRAQSYVRSVYKEGDFRAHVFDYVGPGYSEMPFYERLEYAHELCSGVDKFYPVLHEMCEDYEQLLTIEDRYLTLGYEGLMMRNPMGGYKNGRATMRDCIIWKLKRFVDEEMTVVRLETVQHNNNSAFTDELGFTKRSTHQGNKVAGDMVGVYICLNSELRAVRVAPGSFDHQERREHMIAPHLIVGTPLTVRHFGRTPDGDYRHARAVSQRFD